MKLSGKVYRMEDNINTDVIMPGRWCHLIDEGELAKHCMEDYDKDFHNNIKRGDIIVADDNFGCGSSREVAPLSIKAGANFPKWILQLLAGQKHRIKFDGFKNDLVMLRYDDEVWLRQ